MNAIWFLSSSLILSLGVVGGYSNSNGHSGRNTSSRPAVVNIGAIFSFDSTIGRVAQLAIQEAVKDVNSDPTVLSGTNLSVVMRNSDCSGFLSMLEAMQIMEGHVVAIIGPQSSVVAHFMSYMVSELRVPMLSFAATDPTLSPLQFPSFVRTAHSDLYQMTAVAKIVEYYVWREVTAVFVDDDYGRNGVAALGDALAERRCKVSYKAVIPPGPTVSRDDIVDILGKVVMSESRVIVVHVDPGIGLKVFDAAKSLGMMGKGYVWIATDGLSSVLDSWYHFPADTMDLLQGVLLLRQHSPESHRKRDFYSRWKKLTGGSFGFNSYGLCAYDAVWLIARALDVYFDEGGVISFSNDSMIGSAKGGDHLHLEAPRIFDGDGGRLLLKSVLQSNFVGLSGPLKFDSDRSRILPAYDIINVVGTGIRRTGYWSNYSGLSVVPPETLYQSPNHSTANQHLRSVIWPGETIVKPRGWVFPNNGKTLKIGVPNRVSYREFVEQVQGVDSSQAFRGFCIDVFQAAVNLLPYTVPYKFVPFGDGHKNPSYTELVNKTAMGFFDAAVGDIAIVTNRTKIVDFTQPYAASGLVVVALFRESGSGAWAFMQPFSLPLWGATVSSFAVIGLVVWILEHKSNEDFRGAPKRQLTTVIWFSLSTLFLPTNTVSTLGRLVLLIWLFVVLIINSNYTANLTSILAVQQLSSPIKGIESLKENEEPIGFQVGSFAELYLEKLGISKSRLVPIGSPDEYATKLQLGPKNGGVAAVVDDSTYAELFLSSHCDCRIVGEEFTKSGWGFAFPRDSHLATDLSTAILTLSESGDLQRIHDKWLKTGGCSSDEAEEIQSARLRLKSFGGLFLACGTACLIAILIHFFQIVRQFRRVTTSAEYPSTGSGEAPSHRHRRLRTLLSILDEKQEDEASGSRKRPRVDQPSPRRYIYGEQDEIREA